MVTSSETRREFINFFEKKGHKHWTASAVTPHNDPSLLFVNAGMCQFKAIFLGTVDKATEMGQLRRACNSQKCIRAGGKHNDLEDVGKDVYHQTFFEMLGNWSFGDYFKRESIDFAWELLTEVYGLCPTRLYATYFGGDEVLGLPEDAEARDFWLKRLPADHVLPGNKKDNFWEMGDTGPCGPCSEIHYDRIGNRNCSHLVNQDDPNVLEIWNLVFMQFNREPSGRLSKLPHPCVDTGMGLERLVSCLNNTYSNYDTDLFEPFFCRIKELCPEVPRAYEGRVGDDDPDRIDLAYRAVADHIRTVTVAIADGAVPSNDGRGYVIRRILRRALRYGRQILNAPKNEVWFVKLAEVVAETLGDAFPEIRQRLPQVMEIIKREEKQFSRTLDRGTVWFSRVSKNLKSGDTLDGKTCFELFATYGFPVDLTQVMCEERGLKVDHEGFVCAMKEHQKLSEGGAGRALIQQFTPEQLADLTNKYGVLPTDDKAKYDWNALTGEGPDPTAVVKAIYNGTEFASSVDPDDGDLMIILDKTNFYAESGGQVGDTGFMSSKTGCEITINDTKRAGDFVLHAGRVANGTLAVGDEVVLSCDFTRRFKTAKNHTATHCLNYCLRAVLGDEVDQGGSIVEPGRLRFDFTFNRALTMDEIDRIEKMMTDLIAANDEVYAEEIDLAQAKKIEGLRSVFGENYPNPVRVISVGASVPSLVDKSESGLHHAVEFCGGTHLSNTREMGNFAIISEESVARGMRRIIALTCDETRTCIALSNATEEEIRRLDTKKAEEISNAEFNAVKSELNQKKEVLSLLARKRCAQILDNISARRATVWKATQRMLKQKAKDLGVSMSKEMAESTETFVVYTLPDLQGDFKAMEEFLSSFSVSHSRALAIMLISLNEEQISVLVAVPAALVKHGKAIDWITAALAPVQGKYGGKETTARGTVQLQSTVSVDAIQQRAMEFVARMHQS